MRQRYPILVLSILLSISCASIALIPPDITPKEAISKAGELFKAHIQFKEFCPEIARRTLANYLDEIDPLKVYLIEEEIIEYTEPSDTLITQIVTEYKSSKFTTFEKIYDTMLEAIERRNGMEGLLAKEKPLTGVKSKEIHEASWARSKEDLYAKLLAIKSLQITSAEKLSSEETRDLFYQRLQKRRILHERDFIGDGKGFQKKQMLTYFLKSLSASLDTHTMYFTPSEAKQFLVQVQQRLFGIGAQLRDDLDGFSIVQIVDGGPAEQSNELKIGDKIVAVNHEPVAGMDIVEAVDLIRGPRGSSVILTILREEKKATEKFDIAVVRDEIVLKDTRFKTQVEPFGSGVIGYVALHSFYQDPKTSSTNDVQTAIEEMKEKHNLLGIVLDLRHNTGGLLPQAVQVTGLFIDKGVVASIKDCSGGHQRLRNLADEPVWKGPLVVLINKSSASASEIVAMALSDYGRALIVGDEASYGKGSYQTFTLESSNPDKIDPQGEYKVTRGRYYTVGGRTPQLVGVQSDIVIPGVLSYMDVGEKYNKFPLDNDQIDPLFEDDLSDIHPLYRMRLKKVLSKSPQTKSDTLLSHIPLLSAHSKERIAANRNYQNFLTEIQKADRYNFDSGKIGHNDLQLEEAFNTTKELILLQEPQ